MMKIRLSLFCGILFISLVILASNVIAATYYVATNGSDSNPGTKDLPWATIQKAANTIVPGDTVCVEAGTYNNFPGVLISTSGTELLPITYDANGTVILDGNNGAVDAFLINGADWIIIRDFTIRNFAGDKKCGVHLKNDADHCTIENCEIYNIISAGGTTVAAAIRILNSSYNTIKNNHVHHSYTGIGLRSYPSELDNETTGNIIEGNICNNNDISAENSDGISASDTWIHHNTYRGNVLYSNADDGIDLWLSHDNIVEKNISYSNGTKPGGDGNGFKLATKTATSGNNIVRYNIAYNNPKAGFLSNGRRQIYYNNTAYSNGTNGFLDTKEAGEPGSDLWNNTSTGNTGADLITQSPSNANFNNWCAAGDFHVMYNSANYYSLASYQAAIGKEANSINVNPGFVDAPNADFHLTADSALIDAGTLIQPGLTDRDGTAVPQCDAPDIGAYEFRQIGDFYGGCDVDFRDFAVFAMSWMLEDGQTGYNSNCDISIPADGIIDENDLEVFADYWLVGK